MPTLGYSQMRYENARGMAKRLLQHYVGMAFYLNGLKWDSDNDAEVAGIVDNIETMIKELVAKALEEREVES